jgi:hypothetical protein
MIVVVVIVVVVVVVVVVAPPFPAGFLNNIKYKNSLQ